MKNKSLLALLFALALFLSGYAVMEAQTIRQNFEWVIAKRITVTLNGITVQRGGVTVTDGGITVEDDDVTVTEGVTAADVTVTDDLTVDDDASIGSDLTLGQQTVFTITQAGTLTPTGTYQQLTAAGAVSFGSIVTGTAGDVLTLVNIGSNTITITDTGTLKLSGNAALGQYDSVTLLSDGTNWIQVAPESDN